MNKEIEQKIQVLMQRVKGEKTSGKNIERKDISSNIHNSLAENIKTKEQAKSFMTLVRAL